MNKLTIICSIDGWKTTRNINMVQTTGESIVHDESITTFYEPSMQLDSFYVTIRAADLGEADILTHDKLTELTGKLRSDFADFGIDGFNSYPASCPENVEESIEFENLSLLSIIEKSPLLQQIKKAKELL